MRYLLIAVVLGVLGIGSISFAQDYSFPVGQEKVIIVPVKPLPIPEVIVVVATETATSNNIVERVVLFNNEWLAMSILLSLCMCLLFLQKKEVAQFC